MATLSEKRVEKLHDKFFHNTITEEERKELFDHFKSLGYHESILGDYLFTSHPDYGKPDKDGFITII